jgi:hypothetical protein
VQLAAPAGVFPFALAKAYQRQRRYDMRVNWFPDGRQVRQSLVGSDQSVWTLTTRLKPTDQQALQNWYAAHLGGHIPFYYYDMDETHFAFDATGSSTLGRYIVRFQGGTTITNTRARVETAFTLIQIA